jgi:hypothetical protein
LDSRSRERRQRRQAFNDHARYVLLYANYAVAQKKKEP